MWSRNREKFTVLFLSPSSVKMNSKCRKLIYLKIEKILLANTVI